MSKEYDVVIIGAGTAGLSARREVAKVTDNYLVVDDGPLGTTCARVGCMPSKVLIQVANDFYRKNKFKEMGISGGEHLSIDHQKVMLHVRQLRDRFVRGVTNSMESWQKTHLCAERATFIDNNTLAIGSKKVTAKKIIIAAGSRPVLPKAWQPFQKYLINTDEFFELKTLPKKIAVIGLGVIGIELGQALHRLGVEVIAVSSANKIGGATDPVLQDYIAKKMGEEFTIYSQKAKIIGEVADGIQISSGDNTFTVDKVFLTMGRRANSDLLGLENLDLELDAKGIPVFDPDSHRIIGTQIYIAGDVTQEQMLLHEAADEGLIVGHNAVASSDQGFKRRTALSITFSAPNICVVGKSYGQLEKDKADFVTGMVSFEGQGRAIVKLAEKGLMHIYVEQKSRKILGAELFAPSGEHLAHLLAWAISLQLTVEEALSMPFYHPVLEEGMRTALRDARSQLPKDPAMSGLALFRCQDSPIR